MKREIPGGSNERRQGRRYSLKMELEWKLIHGRAVPYSGSGYTIDLSNSGILFDAGVRLPEGAAVEMSIYWPAKRPDAPALRLVILGLITRSEGRRAAIQISRQEFCSGPASIGETERPAASAPASPITREIQDGGCRLLQALAGVAA